MRKDCEFYSKLVKGAALPTIQQRSTAVCVATADAERARHSKP